MKLLELKGIRKHFHAKTALDGIDLSVEKGDSLTILGPNGAGKTTLLKIISGIMSPTEGEIFYRNNLCSGRDMKSEVSFLGHNNSLYNSLTVKENIQFIYGLFSRNNGGPLIETILRDYGLWERRNDPVKELSQGMKRRLAIAKGFITEPEVFVMDEPFTGLDLRWRNAIIETIISLKRYGKSLILSTHLVEEGYRLADHIAFLNKGRLMFIKKKEELGIEEIKGLFHSLGQAVQ